MWSNQATHNIYQHYSPEFVSGQVKYRIFTMCRLTIYKGRPLLIGNIVIEPENSLLYQSRDAAYHPGVLDNKNQRNILVNGDGFGVSWYGDSASKGSCCFKFVTPAWSDTNLRNIGRHISSPLMFAHVRAAASGHNPFEPMIVSNENCHPFTYKEYTFMHNGGIPCFHSLKLKILNLLSPETFANIKGTTDTEHIFAIYLNCLPPFDTEHPHTVSDMVAAMNQTISIVVQLCKETCITDHCSLNLCVTNGTHVIATRFRTGPKSPPSLYYNFGSNFVCRNGNFYAEDDTYGSEIVISSAPLSKVENLSAEVEQDVPYSEGDTMGSPGSPQTSFSPKSYNHPHNQTHSLGMPVMRTSASTASLRAMLHDGTDPTFNNTNQYTNTVEEKGGDPDSRSDSDIGSWILIPKNHMLVCRGLPTSSQVDCIYLEPIVVHSSVVPLSCPLRACKRKTSMADSCRWDARHGDGGTGEAKKARAEEETENFGLDIDEHDNGNGNTTSNESASTPLRSAVEQLLTTTPAWSTSGALGTDTPSVTAPWCTLASPSASEVLMGTPNNKNKLKIMKFTCQQGDKVKKV